MLSLIRSPQGLTVEQALQEAEKVRLLDLAYYASSHDMLLRVRINETGEIIGGGLCPKDDPQQGFYRPHNFTYLLEEQF